jgi:hypothetical protein
LLGGFAEFEIGRVKQTLLLFRIEQTFRRQQFEHFNAIAQGPAMGGGTLSQLALGFRQGDIETLLAGLCALHQELQGDGGFAGSRLAFHQENVAPRESAGQDLV